MAEAGERCVALANVSFAFGNGPRVLDGVSLEIATGERVALVGPNGAGKSTLLRHVIGLLQPLQGTVSVRGLAVARPNLAAVRRQVGFVFQDPDDQLFSPSVVEDVAFGPLHLGLPQEQIADRVRRALGQVGLEGVGHRPAHQLSHGERQRAAIATVLSYDPEILVFDEPTANLDPKHRRRLIGLLQALGCTLLVATHDLDLAWELCPRTVLLCGGRVVVDGDTRTILSDAALLEQNDLERPLRFQGGDRLGDGAD
jgi:cobalt/nickel transport system ATP-binding protein